MLFNSTQYLIFLPIVVLLFWILPQRLRLPMLLLASYIFYASWIPGFVFLIFFLTVFNWLWGKVLHRATVRKKLVFGIGLAANILTLGVFKYANFSAHTIQSLLHLTTGKTVDWSLNIILPLGISFFVFEFVHYLFEIYRGNKPIDSFILFALFAAFFPTQIAGPIKRYPDFVAQMTTTNKLRLQYFDEGIPLIVMGLAKKCLLADNLSYLVQVGFSTPGSYGAPELWLFTYAFAFQIYFDFSGYTDIGRGSAMLFGYHIPINFNLPFIAKNMSDFWHRWHISLSTWLRDYLFIPMGGSRKGEFKTCRNLFITFAIGGLWHGASWSFVIWGIYHGLCLVAHRTFANLSRKIGGLEKFWETPVWRYFSIFLTFQAVCIGDVFFRLQDTRLAFNVVRKMLTLHPIYSPEEAGHFFVFKPEMPVAVPLIMALVVGLIVLNLPLSALNQKCIFKNCPPVLKAAYCAIVVIAMVTLMPDTSAPFVYFQF